MEEKPKVCILDCYFEQLNDDGSYYKISDEELSKFIVSIRAMEEEIGLIKRRHNYLMKIYAEKDCKMDNMSINKDRNSMLAVQKYRIHFNECWDEDFYLIEEELKDWLGEIVDIINDDNLRINEKMQRIVDSVV